MTTAAYARIASDLRQQITSRDINPGGRLPSELELRDRYQASRNTVLNAIKLLRDEGLAETRPGQGWFAKIRIVPFVNSIDWEDDTAIAEAKARGRTPKAMPPTVNTDSAPADIADRLGVPVGTEMIVRRQEWLLDGLPWKLQVGWCQKIYSNEGAHQLLVAEDISEGVGRYRIACLAWFRPVPRSISCRANRAMMRSGSSASPMRATCLTSSNSSAPRPLRPTTLRGRFTRLWVSTPATGIGSRVPGRLRGATDLRSLPSGSAEAHQVPGGPGTRARQVEPKLPPHPVLPADSERELEEGANTGTGDDRNEPQHDKTGHDGLPATSRVCLRVPGRQTSQTDPHTWIIRLSGIVHRVPAQPHDHPARISPMHLMIHGI